MNKVNGWLEIRVGHWVGFGYCPISDWVQFLPSNRIGSGLIQHNWIRLHYLLEQIKNISNQLLFHEFCMKIAKRPLIRMQPSPKYHLNSKYHPNPNSSKLIRTQIHPIRFISVRIRSDLRFGWIQMVFFCFPQSKQSEIWSNSSKSEVLQPYLKWEEKIKRYVDPFI